jgi:hypothetical protein
LIESETIQGEEFLTKLFIGEIFIAKRFQIGRAFSILILPGRDGL